jgi:alpha-ribazole phosphatase
MDIYLIRHTKTDVPKGLCYGRTDVPLADSFPEDLQILKQKLPILTNDCLVYSSGLGRCVQLAEQLSEKVQRDERLLEVNFGDWENQRFDELPQDLVKQWTSQFVTVPPPNGECFADLCQRVGEFWQELITHDVKQVLIVTHAGVIRALLAHLLNLPPANAFQFKVDYGSVHKLQYVSQYTYIHYINS